MVFGQRWCEESRVRLNNRDIIWLDCENKRLTNRPFVEEDCDNDCLHFELEEIRRNGLTADEKAHQLQELGVSESESPKYHVEEI
jgi:hypothetical protein